MHNTITTNQFRGRKMKPGRAVADPNLGIRYFVCYCDNCQSKIVCTRDYIQSLIKTSHRASGGLRMRIIKLLMATMKVKDL